MLKNLVHEVFYAIKVRGEISSVSHPSSGHTYFTLKDATSVLNAVCWNHTKVNAPFRDGSEVTCSGHLSIYQSRYQLIISDMELVGDGVVYDGNGSQVVSASSVSPNDIITIELKDGKVRALVLHPSHIA